MAFRSSAIPLVAPPRAFCLSVISFPIASERLLSPMALDEVRPCKQRLSPTFRSWPSLALIRDRWPTDTRKSNSYCERLESQFQRQLQRPRPSHLIKRIEPSSVCSKRTAEHLPRLAKRAGII